MGRGSCLIWKVLVCVLLAGGVVLAQVTTGTISGTVTDSTGAVIPGARITLRHIETGLVRNAVSDEAGRYRTPNLPLGEYEVEGANPGFQTEVRRGITLTLGREAMVNIQLQVGAVTERVEVTAEAPLVNTTSASIEFLVDDKKISELPLNGRSYTQLATLQPGVAAFTMYSDNLTLGHGQGLSIAGAKVDQNSFLMDGQDIMDYAGRTPGSATASNLGVEAIREFSIQSSSSAEYGLVTGGVMNVVTKSGTNQLHGSAFEFLRNSALDAKNYFDPHGDPIPPFKRNQLGVSSGGPIVKDRMFFLGAFEGLRERRGLTVSSPVPNARAHQGYLPDITCPTGCGQGAKPGERFIGISPLMVDRMNLFPLPNGEDFGDGTGLLTSNPITPGREDYVMGRVDSQLNNNNSLFGRYTFDHATSENPEDVPFFIYTKRSRYQYALINWTSILSPASINEARIGFNRSIAALGARSNFALCSDIDNCPQLAIVKGFPHVAAFSIQSPVIGGGNDGGHLAEKTRRFPLTTFEFADNVSYTRGSHSLKMGAVHRRYYANPRPDFNLAGALTFNTLREFMLADPISISGQDSPSAYSVLQNLFGWFVQDTFRISQNLTLNLGIRQEFTTPPSERYGRMAVLRSFEDTAPTVGPIFRPPKANFSPRAGLAWDVFGDGRTSVRIGGGIYQEQLLPTTKLYTFSKFFPFFKTYSLQRTLGQIPPGLVVDLNALATTSRNPSFWEFEPTLPSKYQWNFEIQREFLAGTTVSAAYVGSRYLHNEVGKTLNLLLPGRLPDGRKCFLTTAPCNAPGRRKNPGLGNQGGTTFEGDAYYQSLQLNLLRRFSRGLQYQGAYTWSRSIDSQSARFGAEQASNATISLQDPDDLRGDRGLSAMDVRHNLTSNVTYDLPFGKAMSGAGKHLVAGWQINVMATLRTGLSFSAQSGVGRSQNGTNGAGDRPDLRTGMNNNPTSGTTIGCPGIPAGQKLRTVERYFDPCVFAIAERGTYGNLGKSTIIGPGFVNFDLAGHKTFNFYERTSLQFRVEFFNLFNRPNFGDIGHAIFRSATEYNGSAGRILSTLNTSRQIQFGLKLSF